MAQAAATQTTTTANIHDLQQLVQLSKQSHYIVNKVVISTPKNNNKANNNKQAQCNIIISKH